MRQFSLALAVLAAFALATAASALPCGSPYPCADDVGVGVGRAPVAACSRRWEGRTAVTPDFRVGARPWDSHAGAVRIVTVGTVGTSLARTYHRLRRTARGAAAKPRPWRRGFESIPIVRQHVLPPLMQGKPANGESPPKRGCGQAVADYFVRRRASPDRPGRSEKGQAAGFRTPTPVRPGRRLPLTA